MGKVFQSRLLGKVNEINDLVGKTFQATWLVIVGIQILPFVTVGT